MIALFKKYWFRALLFLLWAAIVFFFDPWQKQFYLPYDIEGFTTTSHLVLMGMGLALFLYILFHALKRREKAEQFFVTSVTSFIWLFCFCFTFQSTFTAFGLFINRQTGGDKIKRSYVVGYLNDDKSDKKNLYLYDINNGKLVNNERLADSLYAHGLNSKDTIRISFTKGLFGVNYYEKLVVEKQ